MLTVQLGGSWLDINTLKNFKNKRVRIQNKSRGQMCIYLSNEPTAPASKDNGFLVRVLEEIEIPITTNHFFITGAGPVIILDIGSIGSTLPGSGSSLESSEVLTALNNINSSLGGVKDILLRILNKTSPPSGWGERDW